MPVDQATRRRILQANQRYNSQVDQIRRDPYLSTEGKRRALGTLYYRHQAWVAAERARADARARERAEALRQRLFSPPPGAILEWRDAVDRLGGVDSVQKMQGMLRTARTVGDTTMIQAILAAAWGRAAEDRLQRGWTAVVEEAIQGLGEQYRPYAEELAGIERAADPKARFTEGVELSVVRPEELAGISDMELARWSAEQQTPQGGAA